MSEVPLSKPPKPQLLPGVLQHVAAFCSGYVFSLLVCVYFHCFAGLNVKKTFLSGNAISTGTPVAGIKASEIPNPTD